MCMANWYDKYMTIYGKHFSEVPQEVIDGTRERLARLQSKEPVCPTSSSTCWVSSPPHFQ